MTSTTVTTTVETSTLCFTKPSCASQAPFDPPGTPAAAGASPMGPKMCGTGCGCARITGVMCPRNCVLLMRGAAGNAMCPLGCVPGGRRAIPDPCNSCTVTDPMADMMVATCPGRKKRRAILEPAFREETTEISPSPVIFHSDIER